MSLYPFSERTSPEMSDDTSPEPRPLTVQEFARKWHVSERTVRHWIRWQRVETVRTRRTNRVRSLENAHVRLPGSDEHNTTRNEVMVESEHLTE